MSINKKEIFWNLSSFLHTDLRRKRNFEPGSSVANTKKIFIHKYFIIRFIQINRSIPLLTIENQWRNDTKFDKNFIKSYYLLSCQVKTTVAWHQLKLMSKLGSGFSKQWWASPKFWEFMWRHDQMYKFCRLLAKLAIFCPISIWAQML